MKKILFVVGIWAAVSFVSCSKTCKCTILDDDMLEIEREIYSDATVENYNFSACTVLSEPGRVECSMQ